MSSKVKEIVLPLAGTDFDKLELHLKNPKDGAITEFCTGELSDTVRIVFANEIPPRLGLIYSVG